MDALLPFQFPFKDKEWGQKFVVLALLTLAMTAFFGLAIVFSNTTPILAIILVSIFVILGLFPLCVALGYLLGIVRRVTDDDPIALPYWESWDELIARGAGLLLVIGIYNIPLIISIVTLIFVPRFLGNTNFAGWASLLMLCCVLPFVFIITVLGWLCLAVGAGKYAKGGGLSLFFRPEELIRSAFAVGSMSAQWVMLVIVYNLVFTVMLLIPCIGWTFYGAFLIPAHGHLLGQYTKFVNKAPPPSDKQSASKPRKGASQRPAPKSPRPLGSAPKRK
ncbi:MAG: DUF4013 domain-containing protein [Anaerolineae bacterium]|nr:DUF4013 domain-containing protein [Anaerolineae bacterium]